MTSNELAAVIVAATPSAPSAGGLILDVAGALFLAYALISRTAERAIEETTALNYRNYNAALDLTRAQETADAQIGAALLVLGFLTQLSVALGWRETTWLDAGLACYGALVLVAMAVALERPWRKSRIRGSLAARLRVEEMGHWWPVMAEYGRALDHPPTREISVEITFAEYGEQLLGRRRWTRLVGDKPLPDVMVKLRRDLVGTREYAAAHPEAQGADPALGAGESRG
jgi:hypothetical protein